MKCRCLSFCHMRSSNCGLRTKRWSARSISTARYFKRIGKDSAHHRPTILEAKQSINPLPLLQEGAHHAAILNGPGPFAVSLGVAAPLTIEAGRASFMLPVPLASSSILTLELPGNHANVRIEPGLVTSRDNGQWQTRNRSRTRTGQTSAHLVDHARNCRACCAT